MARRPPICNLHLYTHYSLLRFLLTSLSLSSPSGIHSFASDCCPFTISTSQSRIPHCGSSALATRKVFHPITHHKRYPSRSVTTKQENEDTKRPLLARHSNRFAVVDLLCSFRWSNSTPGAPPRIEAPAGTRRESARIALEYP